MFNRKVVLDPALEEAIENLTPDEIVELMRIYCRWSFQIASYLDCNSRLLTPHYQQLLFEVFSNPPGN